MIEFPLAIDEISVTTMPLSPSSPHLMISPAVRGLALSSIVAALSLSAQQPSETIRGWTDFARRFDSLAQSGGVVGASAEFVRDGRIVARHDFGMADRARGQRVNARTLFHYGSITKTLTAIAVMQLRDRGALTLDDPIVRWVPELRRVHDAYGAMDSVTIRMLLSHSSGFQDPTWPYSEGRSWEPFEPTTWNQLVAMMPYQELVFRPGERFGYSNPGYIYLSRVIEAISGDPWESYIQKNIFAPLALDRSYFGATPYYLAADRSNNYTVVRDSVGRSHVRENGRDFNPGITIPNGGWNAPLSDLATYVAFLTDATRGDTTLRHRYDAVLSRATLAEMWRPIVRAGSLDSSPQSLGLGFFVLQDGARTIIGHTGSQAGFLSFMWIDPATSSAVVVSLNTAVQGGAVSPFSAIQHEALALLR